MCKANDNMSARCKEKTHANARVELIRRKTVWSREDQAKMHARCWESAGRGQWHDVENTGNYPGRGGVLATTHEMYKEERDPALVVLSGEPSWQMGCVLEKTPRPCIFVSLINQGCCYAKIFWPSVICPVICLFLFEEIISTYASMHNSHLVHHLLAGWIYLQSWQEA